MALKDCLDIASKKCGEAKDWMDRVLTRKTMLWMAVNRAFAKNSKVYGMFYAKNMWDTFTISRVDGGAHCYVETKEMNEEITYNVKITFNDLTNPDDVIKALRGGLKIRLPKKKAKND